jgi:hypothetical protein
LVPLPPTGSPSPLPPADSPAPLTGWLDPTTGLPSPLPLAGSAAPTPGSAAEMVFGLPSPLPLAGYAAPTPGDAAEMDLDPLVSPVPLADASRQGSPMASLGGDFSASRGGSLFSDSPFSPLAPLGSPTPIQPSPATGTMLESPMGAGSSHGSPQALLRDPYLLSPADDNMGLEASPGGLPSPAVASNQGVSMPSPMLEAPVGSPAASPSNVSAAVASPGLAESALAEEAPALAPQRQPWPQTLDGQDEVVSFLGLARAPPGDADLAARRFLNLLSMHMDGQVTLDQTDAYGDISVHRGPQWPTILV